MNINLYFNITFDANSITVRKASFSRIQSN